MIIFFVKIHSKLKFFILDKILLQKKVKLQTGRLAKIDLFLALLNDKFFRHSNKYIDFNEIKMQYLILKA